MAFRFLLIALMCMTASAFQMGPKLQKVKAQGAAAFASPLAAAVTLHAESAHAKSVLGVNGALDFGPLAGDQPGGEGTGKVSARPQTHTPTGKSRCLAGRTQAETPADSAAALLPACPPGLHNRRSGEDVRRRQRRWLHAACAAGFFFRRHRVPAQRARCWLAGPPTS